MTDDSLAYLRERLEARRALLRQATDAMAMRALRDDIVEIEGMMRSLRDLIYRGRASMVTWDSIANRPKRQR
jgi:hypothetical protein